MAVVWLVLFASCTLTEQVFLNEDGTGTYRLGYDGSGMMAMMDDMGTSDSTQSEAEQDVDSVLVFRDLIEQYKDSIAQLDPEEQKKLEALRPYKMHIVMSEAEKKMLFTLEREFGDLGELSGSFKDFQTAMSMNDTTQADSPFGSLGQYSEVEFGLKKNRFTRTATLPDSTQLQLSESELQSMDMMFDATTYKIEYHFPRKVKSTTLEGALFSADGKTMTYELSMKDIMKNPEALNFEVELEKR